MSEVRVRGLSKHFGAIAALESITFHVPEGAILGVIGPSGCGKTTLLRVIAGLESPDTGDVVVADRTLVDASQSVPPERRGIGLVFQDYALFPHLNVAGNIGYGVKNRARREERVQAMLELVGLEGAGSRRVGDLSGGQQQRVALARALAPQPALLLLDEPFSNLDADLRARVRHEVRAILRAARQTAIFVTHDQEEAFEISDFVAVMQRGRFEQIGSPEETYRTPATRFVADFVGQATFLPAEVRGGQLQCPLGTFDSYGVTDGPAQLMLRPEDVAIVAGGTASVLWRRFQGRQSLYCVRIESGEEVLSADASQTVHLPGDLVTATFQTHRLVIFRNDQRVDFSKS